jgi:transcriptional regulator with XRE-family HTH domain
VLKRLRTYVGLELSEADKLAGVPRGTHERLERGRSGPPHDTTVAPLAALYGVRPEWLKQAGGDELPSPAERVAAAVARARERVMVAERLDMLKAGGKSFRHCLSVHGQVPGLDLAPTTAALGAFLGQVDELEKLLSSDPGVEHPAALPGEGGAGPS